VQATFADITLRLLPLPTTTVSRLLNLSNTKALPFTMSSKGLVTRYRIKTSPSRKSSSSSSHSPTKDRHDCRSHSYTLHQNTSRDSISSASRHPQSDDDVVIFVMGMTGSGKSTLINLLADEKVKVGHSLQSCTTEVQVASFSTRTGRLGYLIDTPGFDDTNRCDSEILKEITAFLTKLYVRKIRVTGLIYVHRITDPKMQGSAVKNLEMFQKLCGAECFPQVALVSTMWQELRGAEAQALGEEREAELRSNVTFWGAMDQGKSRIFRHFGERESAAAVVHWLLSFPHKLVLNIQRELVEDGLTLDQTEAGKFLQETSARVKEKYEKEIRLLQTAINDAHQEHDSQTENELLLQRIDVEAALERVDRDSRDMRINVRQLEAEKGPEYVIRVEEMERERVLKTSLDVSALQAKLEEVQDDMDLVRQNCQRKEKELRQQAEAIRRQDSAKAQDQITRLKDELSLVEAQYREQTKAFEDLAERLQVESSLQYGASRVLGFMRNLAPVFWNRHDPRPLYLDEGLMVTPPRRMGTSDSVQPIARGGGDCRTRF
jgi:GTP-binding protein EngB required for normal cell division